MQEFVVGLALAILAALIVYWEWRADRAWYPEDVPSSHRRF